MRIWEYNTWFEEAQNQQRVRQADRPTADIGRLTLPRLADRMVGQTGELGVAKLRGEPWDEAPGADSKAFDSYT